MGTTTCSTEWIDALVDTATELAHTSPGIDEVQRLETYDTWTDSASGAFVALVGEETSVQLGITADFNVCKKLANLFLGMDADDDELPREDVVDVMGELTNIVAGMCKTRMAEVGQHISLSIPLFMEGRVPDSDNQRISLSKCLFGDLPVQFIVLQPTAKGASNDHGS